MKIKLSEHNVSTYNNETISFNTDEILTGTIKSEIKDNFNIQIKNMNLTLPKGKIKGNTGDTVKFEVLKSKDNKIKLRQILDNKIEDKELDEFYFNKKAELENSLNEDLKNYRKFTVKKRDLKMVTTKEIKRALGHINNTFNEKSIENMLNENLNPEKNSIFTISKFISQSTGIDPESNNEEKIYDKNENQDTVKMDINMNGVDEESIFNFEEILLKNGLPITERNIEQLNSLKTRFENIEEINNNATYDLIKKDNEITLEDLYTHKYSGFLNEEATKLNIEDLDQQIKGILLEENIEFNEENITLAKDFIKNEIELTKENFDKFNKIKNFKQNFELSEIIKEGIKNIYKNENIFTIPLFKPKIDKNLKKDYEKIIQTLPKIKIENIQTLIDKGLPINLKNIRNEYSENKEVENLKISEEAILERLNVAKIQMKLTSESIFTLTSKGFDINIKPLKEVIEKLENIELENYKNALDIMETPANYDNLQKMQGVYSSLHSFYPTMVYSTFKEINDNKIDFSISGISESIKSKRVFETFDTFKTVPNSIFGDKISLLDNKFEKLLNDNGFDITEKNVKSAKILTLNNMEFTENNMFNVKLIDSKIEYIYNKLQPIIVSNMLKDGFDPMKRKIDELIQYIDEFSEKFGQSSREKIAEQILEIDKDNKLTFEEREAIISVYRMLNIINKGENRAIGTFLQSEKNLTLGNLLEASKTYDRKKRNIDFDEKIDDLKGLEKETHIPEKNIQNSIKKALNNEEKGLEYNKFILTRLINHSDYGSILTSIKNYKDKNIDEIINMEKSNASETLKNDILKENKFLGEISQETINYLLKNNIGLNTNNLYNLESAIKDGFKTSENIEDFSKELKNRNIIFGKSIPYLKSAEEYTLEKAINSIDKLEKENIETFDEILNLNELDDIKYMILKNKNVNSGIKFLKDVNNNSNGIYNLPIRLNSGKITDLSMVILNNKSMQDKNFNLFLNFNNDISELTQAYVKVMDNGAYVNIIYNEEDNKDFDKNEKDILNILKKFKIEPKKIMYSKENSKNIFKDNLDLKIEEKLENTEQNFNKII